MPTHRPVAPPRGAPRRVSRRLAAAVALATVLASAATAAAPARAAATGKPLIYCADAATDTVSVYDVGAGAVTAAIPVGDSPVAVGLAEPGEVTGYTANQGDGTVSVIDVPNRRVTATVPVGQGPEALAVAAYAARVYVANRGSGTVSVIDTGTDTVMATVPLGGRTPVAMGLSRDERWLYVAETDGTVTEIDTNTLAVSADVAVGTDLRSVSFSATPDDTAFVAGDDAVYAVAGPFFPSAAPLPAGSHPMVVAVNPAGDHVFAGESGTDAVAMLSPNTGIVVGTFPVGGVPTAMSFDLFGNVYVLTDAGTVSVINSTTRTVTATLGGFGSAVAMAVGHPLRIDPYLVAPNGGTVVAGTRADITAGVNPAEPGTIQFFDGQTALGDPVGVDSAGAATYPADSLAVGRHTLTAVFTPESPVLAVGSSLAVTLTVTPAALTADRTVDKTGTSAVTTDPFSTAGPRLLVAYTSSDGPAAKQSTTVTGAGLTWTLVRRADPAGTGTAEIWFAQAPGPLTGVTVTSTPKIAGFDQQVTVIAYADAGGIGASAIAGGGTKAESVGLTTTVPGSWVFGVGEDYSRDAARVPGSGQTVLSQYIDPVPAETFWVQDQTAPTPAAGTAVTLNDTTQTADRWNLAAVEILPAPQK